MKLLAIAEAAADDEVGIARFVGEAETDTPEVGTFDEPKAVVDF